MGSVRTDRMASRARWQLIPILLTIWAAPIWAQGGQQDAVRGQVANPHGHLTLACEGCHTTTAWRPVRKAMEFDHNTQTSFALRGMHQSIPCTGCHVDLVFSKAPTQCSECHADLHRRQFGANCQQCHTVQGWNVQVSAIQDHNNRFPLLGAHAAVICDQCHRGAASGVFTGLSTQCVSCHLRDFQTTTTPLNHVAAGLPTTCETCHNSMNSWQQGTRFDHAQFAHFALTGMHATLQCQQCHVGNRFAGTPAACIGCHLNDYRTTKAPDHVAGNFSQDCAGCHNTTSWTGATFDHNTTGFPLTGAHTSLACAQCHVNNNYALPSGACWNCHQNDYNSATNPDHKTSAFPQDCTGCHNTTSWAGATFNHASTGFALLGAHNTLMCTQCHNPTNGNYSITSANCMNCHAADYNGATNPDHKAANFPANCDGCHNMNNWLGATFNHASTGFALVGMHASQQCAACHVNNNYTLNRTTCITCHLADFNGANNPPHTGFSQDCTTCHGTSITDWTSATFFHASTGFTLTGAHTSLQCTQCHNTNFFPAGAYNIPGPACAPCHMTDYNGTTNPSHVAAGFPTTCDTCHTTVAGWGGANFNHTTTGFTLTGAHTSLQCTQCHNAQFGNYSITSPSCAPCHMTDYNGTTNPPHAAAGFPTTCDSCHTTNLTTPPWAGATFTHPSSPLALTGYHANMLATNQCTACHNTMFSPSGAYNISSGACWNCHQAEYNSTNNPPHAAQGFPMDCSGCHTFVDWSGATFNHATTGFALTGAHTTQACTACHTATAGYNIQNALCYNCHSTEYNGTTNPPHVTAGFPQDCSMCHSTNATTPPWAGATFTHPSTPLALTGFHATMLTNNQCNSCHVGNNYTTTPSDCWSCHGVGANSDWNMTTNPGHQAAFTTTLPDSGHACNACHSFTDWTGAQFTAHDTLPTGFLIYSGKHLGLWHNCTDCHTSSSDYTTTTLTCMSGNCHPQSETDTAHIQKNVQNYSYSAPRCYACHPRVT